MRVEKNRQSNFELLRIIAMLMVVTVHYVGHGGALKQTEVFSNNFYVANALQSLAAFSVPLFTCIGSYFMCERNFNIKKILLLWIQVLFYSVGIYLLLSAVGIIDFSLFYFIKSIFPIIMNQYGFVTAYMIMIILSPFLNKAILALNQNEHKKLVIILFIIFVFFGAGFPMGVVTDSYVSLLLVIYLSIAYIKKYVPIDTSHKKYLWGYLLSAIGIFTFRMIFYKIGLGFPAGIFFAYNSTLVIIGTFALFIYFRTINIQSKLINKIATLTFGVYLIHDNNYIRELLYSDVLNTESFFNSDNFLVIALFSILSIFIVCALIEFCRSWLFNKFKVNQHIVNLGCRYISKFKNIGASI